MLVSPAMPFTESNRELVQKIEEAARLEGFEAKWVDAGGGSDANRIALGRHARSGRRVPRRCGLPFGT
ncbi:hypothetical protein [uncultured Sutterella sp.]|uniref:hypothetical protein n=1 Tax=uncultured Sutterella sp. TaxID=286133 RepID=UPI002621409F|nr:hypothetical protein [uncultured Sutterella sp.]